MTWTAWPPPEDGEEAGSLENTLPTAAGSYYLTEDVILAGTWEVPAGGVDLCLNGHMIREPEAADGEKFTLIHVPSGGALRITDCTPEDNGPDYGFTVDESGLWSLTEAADAPKTVHGGVITGGLGKAGGGVCNNGALELYGGAIAGCVCTGDLQGGGGVYTNGPFDMWDGAILGCIIKPQGSSLPLGGGGVYCQDGTFSLYGGRIEECRTTSRASTGGAVYVSSSFRSDPASVWNMYGGAIRSCTAYRSGGAGAVFYGLANLAGGVIESCSAVSGGALNVGAGGPGNTTSRNLRLSGTIIQDCYAKEEGGGIFIENGTFQMTGGAISRCTADGTLWGNNDFKGFGGGIFIKTGASLSITGGSVSDCLAQKGDGGGIYLAAGTLKLGGLTITNCQAQGSGGGIYAGGQLTSGGEGFSITGCKALTGNGGGIYCGGSLTMTGGSVEGCEASGDGGGICLDQSTATLTLSGVSVTDCIASGSGGGVLFGGNGQLTLSGITVKDCQASSGGGIDLRQGFSENPVFSGVTSVTGNTAGTASSNLCLPVGIWLDADGLETGSAIGVSTEDARNIIKIAECDEDLAAVVKACFAADDPLCKISGARGGVGHAPYQIQLVRPHFTTQPTDTKPTAVIHEAFAADAENPRWCAAEWIEAGSEVEIIFGSGEDGVYTAAYDEDIGSYRLTLEIPNMEVGQVFSYTLSPEPVDHVAIGTDMWKAEDGSWVCTVTEDVDENAGSVWIDIMDDEPFTLENLSFGKKAAAGTPVGQTGQTLDTSALAPGQYVYAVTIKGVELVSAPVCVHDWDGGATTPPTCTEDGETVYTCTICGKTRAETLDALGHDWGEWFFAPDWAETGTAYRLCTREGCGESEETDQLPQPSDASVWTAGDRLAPTAAENGYQKYTSGEYGTAIEILPALGVYTVAWADGEARITGNRARNCLAVFAAYKNGQLAAVEIVPFTLDKEEADGETVITVMPEAFAPGGNDVRVFLLDGGEDPWPLCARWPAP